MSNGLGLLQGMMDTDGYRIRLADDGAIELGKFVGGDYTSLDADTYTTAASVAIKVKVYDDSGDERFKVWVDGTEELNTTDSAHAAGAVALGGEKPKFDDLEIGYDNNSDNDIDDAGDDLVISQDFASTSVTVSVSHDHAGNLIDDWHPWSINTMPGTGW